MHPSTAETLPDAAHRPVRVAARYGDDELFLTVSPRGREFLVFAVAEDGALSAETRSALLSALLGVKPGAKARIRLPGTYAFVLEKLLGSALLRESGPRKIVVQALIRELDRAIAPHLNVIAGGVH